MAETFGQMLRRLREATPGVTNGNGAQERQHCLSQSDLARRAGVDPAYVNRLERGTTSRRDGRTHTPDRTIVLALAEVLDVSVRQADWMLFAAGCAPQTDWQGRGEAPEAATA